MIIRYVELIYSHEINVCIYFSFKKVPLTKEHDNVTLSKGIIGNRIIEILYDSEGIQPGFFQFEAKS